MYPKSLHIGRASDLQNIWDRRLYRIFEILPGFLVWATFIFVAIFSFVKPVWVALFIIGFDVFWIMNAIFLASFLILSFVRMRRALRTDWLASLDHLSLIPAPEPLARCGAGNNQLSVKSWRDIIHLVIFPMYKESPEVVGGSLEALVDAEYPKENFFVVLAAEERAGDAARRTADILKERFADKFGNFLVTAHPSNIPGEIAGKGSNEAWAAKEAVAKLIEPAQIPFEHVIVSAFDSDTRAYPYYFACLTYHYLTAKNPLRASYQPVPVFNNNIWEAPFFSRVSALGSTIWQLFMQAQPDMLETFSSHSMPLKTLVDIDFWTTKVVSEDSIIFSQCFLAFDGKYQVIPLYYPVSMDANVSRSIIKTAVSVYKQTRRWAYGVEKIPYVLFGFVKNKRIPLFTKLRMGTRLLFGFWSWGCASLLIVFLGWWPMIFGGDEFRESILAFNLPRLTSRLMTFAMVGLLVNSVLTFLLLPPKPKEISRLVYLSFLLQWLFLPLTLIFFSTLPAIEAQTRLMLGKYLGFYVTEKIRRNPGGDSITKTLN